MASGSFEVAVRNEAGKEIIYVTMKGTEAAVQSAKVLSVLKGIGNATIVLGVLTDFALSATGNQSWTKTGVNTGVAIVAGVIGGGPGLAIGATYYIVDKTIGWDRVLTPASNDQWVPNRAVFPDGSSTYVCFKAGTKILSKAGLKPIEQICIGDSVYSYNLDKNAIELNKVLKSFERKTQFGVGWANQVFGEVSKLRRAKRKSPDFHIKKRENGTRNCAILICNSIKRIIFARLMCQTNRQ